MNKNKLTILILIAGALVFTAGYFTGSNVERKQHAKDDGFLIISYQEGDKIRITNKNGEDYYTPLEFTDKPQVFKLIYLRKDK
jgi:hypothetical protein